MFAGCVQCPEKSPDAKSKVDEIQAECTVVLNVFEARQQQTWFLIIRVVVILVAFNHFSCALTKRESNVLLEVLVAPQNTVA